jgi:methionine-S-sulfoxide reductase
MRKILDKITLGMGCFWCGEAIFQKIHGVVKVESGFSGGETEEPSYREVSIGNTGHAEVVQITFDSNIVSLSDLLAVFFEMHNPTSLNRQGADIGTQYRSIVLYHNPKQKEIVEKLILELNLDKYYDTPIVTEVVPFNKFYSAGEYHENFYKNNSNNGYCQFVIEPKLKKLQKLFREKLS